MSGTQLPIGFDRYLRLWRLTPEGKPLVTQSSRLLPVRYNGERAMLKVAVVDEEKAGGALMAWWAGFGAARVLVHDSEAVLLEWAGGSRSLSALARGGLDLQASEVICDVVAALHAPRPAPLPTLVPLSVWFVELQQAAALHGGLFDTAWRAARDLMTGQREIVALHGDIHHDNILDFQTDGWRAIDPKGLWGERGYDYANLFRNPDDNTALQPGRFDRQVSLVSARATLHPERLLRWILAVMGLSASWSIADSDRTRTTLTIAETAAAGLG